MTVFLSLGSNVGDRVDHLRRAMNRLAGVPRTLVRRVSGAYETAPVDAPGPAFVNAVAEVDTELSPVGLLVELKRIEAALGRKPGARNAPRPVDLDIVAWPKARGASPLLTLPHPRAAARRFVLEPLAELAPGLQLSGRPVKTLVDGAPREQGLRRLGALLGAALLALLLGAPARAGWTLVERGVTLQYADAFRLQTDYEDPRIDYVFVAPRWAWAVPDHESFRLAFEPKLGLFTAPTAEKALIGGFGLIGQYAFKPFYRAEPFLEAGAGPLWTDFKLLEGFFDWELLLGLGAHFRFGADKALTVGYRLHHISNAGFYEPNIGVNAHMPYFGMTWFH